LGIRYIDDPNIQLQLVEDRTFLREKLSADDTKTTLLDMANLWEAAANEKLLFNDEVLTAYRTPRTVDDGTTSVSWVGIKGKGSSNVLALNIMYYNPDSVVKNLEDGTEIYEMVDSDIYFNSALTWTNDYESARGNVYDVGTVALHELGHTVGLDDIYNDPDKNYDKEQIMNYYDGRQRYLGAGDITGTEILWGPD
jgi:hypothetical protein